MPKHGKISLVKLFNPAFVYNYSWMQIFLLLYQFGCGILKTVGPKKQDFWPKINIPKGNHCILRKRRAPIHQKLGMILENKVVQKLKFEKMFFLQKMVS